MLLARTGELAFDEGLKVTRISGMHGCCNRAAFGSDPRLGVVDVGRTGTCRFDLSFSKDCDTSMTQM